MEHLSRAGVVCPMWATVLLRLLLTPTSLLAQTTPAPGTPDPRMRLQLEFDPWRMVLRWACPQEQERRDLVCVMLHPQQGSVSLKPKAGSCQCKFQVVTLSQGLSFTLQGPLPGRPVLGTLMYQNPGAEGTAARNFSCVIYEAEFMNCSWAPGHAAPADTQYSLYLQDSKKKWERPCPSSPQASGAQLGCHLRNLSGLTSLTYFRVNGSSSRARIRFFDALLSLRKIEVYDPPRNISVLCSPAHCRIYWQKPQTRRPQGDLEFQYQLRLLRTSDPTRDTRINIPGDESNQYLLPSSQARGQLSVQLRSASARLEPGEPWGAWSRPLHFGCEEPGSSLVHVYVLVVLGTLLGASLLLLVGRRVLGMLFSRVPSVRDKLSDDQQVDQQVSCEKCLAVAGKTESEHILIVTLQEPVQPPAGM